MKLGMMTWYVGYKVGPAPFVINEDIGETTPINRTMFLIFLGFITLLIGVTTL